MLILLVIGSYGCNKSYILHTTIGPPITTEFYTTEPIPTMSDQLRHEININATTFTYPERTLSEIRKTGLDQYMYTSYTVEGRTTTSIHKSTITIAHTVTIYATKTIYSPNTVYTSMYSSPCPLKLVTAATRQITPLNLALTATGALVGLLVISLIVVTTGWVWTCWSMRKKENRPQNVR